eukprot:tig00000042_g15455.t1
MEEQPEASSSAPESEPWTWSPEKPYPPGYFPNLPPLLQGKQHSDSDRMLMKVRDSCVTKGLQAGVFGGLLGAAIGTGVGVFGGVQEALFPNPDYNDVHPDFKKQYERLKAMTPKEKAVHVLQSTRSSAMQWGKNFGYFGGAYTIMDCAFQKVFVRKDIYTTMGASCVTGAAFAIPTGPKSMCAACAGFTAFSVIIEYVLHREHD